MNLHSPLLTDLYQLTMAYSYWKQGHAEQEAVFHLFYRKHPFQGTYAISCGLNSVIDYLTDWHFDDEDIDYLSTLTASDGSPLFSAEFFDYLKQLTFTGSIDAIPEGEMVFANEPILRIQGPIIQCQLIETPLVNLINFASLIATKSARVNQAAQGSEVMEFGLRRAQGPNGGMTASRSAFIGGCSSTSNTLAGKEFNIPVRGTVAHSWIMSYDDEAYAFAQFAEAMPHNTVLLVDTYDTVEGVKKAITVGKQLREHGHDLLGIRLDSGDLADLSIQSRKILDEAGFENTKIVASGDLDEYRIAELINKKAPIDTWGVGTRLATSYDQPSLDAAYKLGAIRGETGDWKYKIKFSNSPGKMTNPGIQQVRRYFKNNQFLGDTIYNIESGVEKSLYPDADNEIDLLTPIIKNGQLIYQTPPIAASRNRCIETVNRFEASKLPEYPVQLDPTLLSIKEKLLHTER